MNTPVNPEAIGLYGLIVTTICFGLEQLGVGVKNCTDHRAISKALAYVALFFGGFCQFYTSIYFYLFNLSGDPATSIYFGTVFAFFGVFWLVIGVFFLSGGEKKVYAPFFLCGLFLVFLFVLKAVSMGALWPLGVVLIIICCLFVVLPVAWYTGSKLFTKLAGVCNVLIGLTTIPLLLSALGF